MPIQYADRAKDPGETLIYSMTFTPGRAIATGDTLEGTPSVTVTRLSDGHDVTSDDLGHVPPIVGMLDEKTLSVNTIFATISGGADGESYKITFTCDTTNGEVAVEEDLVIEVKEL